MSSCINLDVFGILQKNKILFIGWRQKDSAVPLKHKTHNVYYICIYIIYSISIVQSLKSLKAPTGSTCTLSLQTPDKMLSPDDPSDLSYPQEGLQSDADLNPCQSIGHGERDTSFPHISFHLEMGCVSQKRCLDKYHKWDYIYFYLWFGFSCFSGTWHWIYLRWHAQQQFEWKAAGWISGNILFHTDSVPHSVGEEQDCFAGVINSKCMHKPYGHLEVQGRRVQSKNAEPSCSSTLMILHYAVCCTRMLYGQTVQPRLCMMLGQARRCVGMMLNVQTACV